MESPFVLSRDRTASVRLQYGFWYGLKVQNHSVKPSSVRVYGLKGVKGYASIIFKQEPDLYSVPHDRQTTFR